MNKKAKGLGKGLDALLGGEPIVTAGVVQVPVAKIMPNPHQPRRTFEKKALADLAASIREYGVIQPLIVVAKDDQYMLVAGERRLRAAKAAGLAEVPVLVRDYDDPARAAIALIENLQREDLDPIEEAAAYHRLGEEFALTQTEIAKRVGRSRPHITNTLRLLQLPEQIRELLRSRQLTAGQVRPLLTVEDPDRQVELALKVAAEGLSARQAERLAAAKKTAKAKAKTRSRANNALATYMDNLAEQIKLELGTRVRVTYNGSGQNVRGAIRIDFKDLDELERLAEYFK